MNIITKTALANFQRNKSRNILIGIAILLTTILLTTVPTIIFGSYEVQNAAVKELYPTFHVMFRNVDEKTAENLEKDARLTDTGLREDPAYMVTPDLDVTVSMVFADESVCRQNRINLSEGRMPERADEIVVSKGLLDVMGLSRELGSEITIPFQAVQDGVKGLQQEKLFTIVGITPDSEQAEQNGVYSAMVSRAFAQEVIPKGEHIYRFYGCLADADGKSTTHIENELEEIGAEYGISEDDIVPNTEMLSALYIDRDVYMGLGIFMVVIVLAGVLTIYSIYYVSMLGKVQEYGKLRAIGATKKQIRKIVFREGLAVAFIVVPVGVLCGAGIGVAVFRSILGSVETVLTETMIQIVEKGEVSLVQPWIVVLAALTAFFTVYISLLRPMLIAGKVTPIEALRYQGEKNGKEKAKERKGYTELNIRKLTVSNLGRNRRRTVVTILTLGVTGIFFMAVATILSCMSAETMTENEIRSDICVSIDAWSGDMMHPERELQNIQKENPMTKELREQILAVDGVEAVETGRYAVAYVRGNEQLKEENGSDLEVGVSGVNEDILKECKKYVVQGSYDDAKLQNGTGIILADSYITHYSDLTAGDVVELELLDGDRRIQKKFEIVAVMDAPLSFTGSGFVLPDTVLQDFCETDLTENYNIFADPKKLSEVTEAVKEIVQNNEFLEMRTGQEAYEDARRAIGLTIYLSYSVLVIFGMIGILNLVNTMINSVYTRKKELGMLQAVGMSDRQTVHMLQMEGMFYTVGTLVVSLAIGSLAGYGLFLKAKAEGMFGIQYYEYPVIPAILLVAVVVLVQLLITYLVNRNFKRQSLIDRVRFAE